MAGKNRPRYGSDVIWTRLRDLARSTNSADVIQFCVDEDADMFYGCLGVRLTALGVDAGVEAWNSVAITILIRDERGEPVLPLRNSLRLRR